MNQQVYKCILCIYIYIHIYVYTVLHLEKYVYVFIYIYIMFIRWWLNCIYPIRFHSSSFVVARGHIAGLVSHLMTNFSAPFLTVKFQSCCCLHNQLFLLFPWWVMVTSCYFHQHHHHHHHHHHQQRLTAYPLPNTQETPAKVNASAWMRMLLGNE